MIPVTPILQDMTKIISSLFGSAFNSLTGMIIFLNSWKNMDTMDRIPCCSVSMHIKHFKLGQAIDHVCGIKQKNSYRHSPRNHDNGQCDHYHGDDILSGMATFLSIVLRIQLMCRP